MKTAISLPDQLFQAADELAARLGVSRSELFQRAMERFLREHDDEEVTAMLNEVYGTESSQIDSVLLRMQSSMLSAEKW